MPVFDIPMKWDLRTIERVEAKDPNSAEHLASMHLNAPQSDPRTWRIEKRIDAVDFEKMNEMYPIPVPPDPMEGWTCLREPGPYEGGLWELEKDGYTIVVIGDDGPIDVGMGMTTYTWKISGKSLPYDLQSKHTFHNKMECRDAVLEAVSKL